MGTILPSHASYFPGGETRSFGGEVIRLQVLPRVPATGPPDRLNTVRPAGALEAREKDEANWLRAARAGDHHAFGRLVEKHQQRLFHCLLRLCGSADDAEELAQDAFVQAFVKLDSFQENAAFFTWLYRIAFNLAASRARRRRPRTSLDAVIEAGAPEPTTSEHAPDGQMLEQERSQLVHHAIGRLPQEHRQVIVLREIEGLDYQQIADVLETPIGTVRSRLSRARLQLRELLAPLFAEEPFSG